MLAQGIANHIILLERLERFAQIARQLVDAEAAALAEAHLENVFVDGVGRRELLADAVESGGELYGEGEVRIGRRIRHPQLAARPGAAAVRDAYERRSVSHRPRQVRRRLEA